MSEKPSFFAELKRRHVWRVAIAYVVVSWLLLQLAAILFPAFGAPHWAIRLLFAFLVIGFLVALLLAWAFEVTPEGVRRTESAEAEEARPADHRRHVGRVLNVGIIVVLAAAVGILLWRQLGASAKPQAIHVAATAGTAATLQAPANATVIPAKSIAVLPFENLSTDQGNKYFADGMQDLILTKLADIGDLKVISRTSTMQYGSHPQNLKQIGQELGVATLLEGSVQKAGKQVLINVQLIDARTDSHIWAQSYTRTLKNVFGVEGEVAEKIAAALKAKLSPAETKRLATALSDDPAANDLYLRAEYFVNNAVGSGQFRVFLKQAIPLYRQAIARVPDFALAHARLSFAESWLAFNGGVKTLQTDGCSQAQKAMMLAPDLAESHLAIGYCEYYDKGNYAAALKAFDAALKIRPNDANAIAARGFVLRRQGKFAQAVDAFNRSLTLNPRSNFIFFMLGQTYMALDHYNKAEQAIRQAITLAPDNVQANLFYPASILYRTGDVSRTLQALQGNSMYVNKARAWTLTYQRKYAAAIALVESIPAAAFKGGIEVYSHKNLILGDLYRWSGDMAKARTYYAKALPGLRRRLAAQANNTYTAAYAWNDFADAALGLGETDEGMAATRTSLAIGEKRGDHFQEPQILLYGAYRYAQAGRVDKAVTLLSKALATPGIGFSYAPVMLWLDPAWDPIRNSPAFQALLKKYAKYKPATVPTVGSAPAASTAPAS